MSAIQQMKDLKKRRVKEKLRCKCRNMVSIPEYYQDMLDYHMYQINHYASGSRNAPVTKTDIFCWAIEQIRDELTPE